MQQFSADILRYLGELEKIMPEECLILREVGLGSDFKKYNSKFRRSTMLVRMPKRRCDLMVLTARTVWLIEVKRKLNYEAVGQILLYRYLLLNENTRKEDGKVYIDVFVNNRMTSFDITGKNIQIGIAYKEEDEDLKMLCKELGIATFKIR